MLIATPTSHLFKSEDAAASIAKKSDCLELREFMIGSFIDLAKLAHLDEIDVIRPWDTQRKNFIQKVIENYKNLELVTFHMSCNCTSPKIKEGIFVSGGEIMTKEAMLKNAAVNIDWLKKILPNNIQIAVENNNYYPTSAYEDVTEPAFISEVVNSNDIHFLFDISHALVTCYNKKIQYDKYLNGLPLSKLIQIHICSPGIRENGLAYDLHLIPSEDHLRHALSVGNSYGAMYLTLEFYKNKTKLLNFLDYMKNEMQSQNFNEEKYKTYIQI
jgi:uncharacterized protein (UPF0276 family)